MPQKETSYIQSRRSLLADKFASVRKQTLKLVEPLKTEDFVVQPIVDVSPPKWHLAHTTWFFEAFVLEKYSKGYQIYDADFGFMFNSYYEAVGERVLRPNRGFMTRPTIEEVLKYREYVDSQIDAFFISQGEVNPDILDVIEIGLNHEQQHQELMVTDIKYILGHNPLFPSYKLNSGVLVESTFDKQFLEIDEGLYEIGHDGAGFCYDNELGRHKVYLHQFAIANGLVTNGEYLEFIEAGGYQQFQWWFSEAWDWIQNNEIKAPHYWHQIEGKWFNYTLAGLLKLDDSAPVTHVSQYEADAYARWKGFRLPTEFEWEVACEIYSPKTAKTANFVDAENYHPVSPIENNMQFFGDCWEWTNSAYLPYPYFKTADGALGEYNGKFMINQMVLRGGSCATPSDHIRRTYRNFFHPNLRWQFTGIRLAKYL
ncbi:MAG: ergothioneine biosynthesis protein EgtB [Cyclobacteriaceae bacterium]